ncbi:hypothetical protein SAMN04487969_10216 [Paenibacillus algorifonticola]|uniref:Uncharacterized protein n=1 Tax=Paenibacillus algorifonticola TaxID=684063 RepID=A0A1I1ZQU8_9BACL|nr:hypothetical protein [Paenibacillus algorifonticola]SFE33768.1 hypothetical protein SAMN04487969_10216 [Paenibacillus algorifonticola]
MAKIKLVPDLQGVGFQTIMTSSKQGISYRMKETKEWLSKQQLG